MMRVLCRVAAVLVLACGGASFAQEWPARSIKMLVGFAPGGGTDAVARLIAQKMSESGEMFQILTRTKPVHVTLGTQPGRGKPEDFEAFLKTELAKYARLVKDAKISID